VIERGNLDIVLAVLVVYKVIKKEEAEFLWKSLKGKEIAKDFHEEIEQIKDTKIDYETNFM